MNDGRSAKSWRFRIGTWMFYVPFVMFLAAPVIVPAMGFNVAETAAVVGAIIVVAEIIWFASIPLLGKEGFKTIKSKAFGLLKLSEGPISKTRHSVGITLLLSCVLAHILLSVSTLLAYFKYGADDPGVLVLGLTFHQQAMVYYAVLIVAMVGLVVSAYILGADFWERLKKATEWQGSAPA